MSKKRKILLFFVCLGILGEVMFTLTYTGKNHENSVAIINKEVTTNTFVEIKSPVIHKKYKKFLNYDSQKFLVIDPGYDSNYFGNYQKLSNIENHPYK